MTITNSMNIFLIVGLGNPGPEYIRSRHNVGFRVIDELARRIASPDTPIKTKLVSKWSAEVATASYKTQTLIMIKPQTFMNRSGSAVQAVAAYYRIPFDHIIVIHDEIDLPFGSIRVSFQSGAAGHNGVQSIIDTLSSKDFYRVRIGIAPEADAMVQVPTLPHRPKGKTFVLGSFTTAQEGLLPQTLSRSADAVLMLFQQGFQKTASLVNQK